MLPRIPLACTHTKEHTSFSEQVFKHQRHYMHYAPVPELHGFSALTEVFRFQDLISLYTSKYFFKSADIKY